MRAAVFGTDRKIDLSEVPDVPLAPAEVRVRVHAAGICGTDMHILAGDYPSCPPVILGHEFAGEIVEIGEAVDKVAVGDLVSIEPHLYCGKCKACVDGKEHLCVQRRGFGVHMNGGFAEMVVVPERNAYQLPEGVTPELGALAEPLGCCLHGIDRAQIELGDDVVVFGAGPIGLMLARLASRAGAARVIVVEPREPRRDAAMKFGANSAIDADAAVAEIREMTGGYGPDIVFEATGLPSVMEQALEVVGAGGRVVVFGVGSPSARVALSPNRVYRDEITILGSLINPFAHRRALNMLPELGIGSVITHTFPLANISEAFDAARSGTALKVHLRPNG